MIRLYSFEHGYGHIDTSRIKDYLLLWIENSFFFWSHADETITKISETNNMSNLFILLF